MLQHIIDMYRNRRVTDCDPVQEGDRTVCRWCRRLIPMHVHANCQKPPKLSDEELLALPIGQETTREPKEPRPLGEHDGVRRNAEKRLGIVGSGARYGLALIRWGLAGFPTRSADEVAMLMDRYCRPCDAYDHDHCHACGCCVSETMPAVKNKVKMATETCPRGKWPADTTRPLVVVLGLHCSLSGCLAQVLQALGVFMGVQAIKGEDKILESLCEKLLPFPGTEKQFTQPQRVAWLRNWVGAHFQRAGSDMAGAKYPSLCALADELGEAYPRLAVIHISRPVDEAIASLVDREHGSTYWGRRIDADEVHAVQNMLHEAKHKFLERHSHLTVVAEELLSKPSRQVDRICEYLGITPTRAQRLEALRRVRPDLSSHSRPRVLRPWTNDTTVLVKTFERPDAPSRLLASLYRRYPAARVLVGDDSQRPGDWKTANTVRLPYDCGLSKGRNLLVQQAQTPYVLLCDDDLVFSGSTDVQAMYDELRASDFDLMAASVRHRDPDRPPFFGRLAQEGDTLVFEPDAAGQLRGRSCYHVMENFFVAKREALLRVPWDNRLKVGEHIDWTLRAREAGLRIGWLRSVEVSNTGGAPSALYKRARGRVHRMRKMAIAEWAEKLDFNHFVSKAFPSASLYNLAGRQCAEPSGSSTP